MPAAALLALALPLTLTLAPTPAAAAGAAGDPNLSPATWSQATWDAWAPREAANEGFFDVADARGGAVAGTSSAFAVVSGADALAKGGNAMDACVATALAQVALVGGQYVSYAGIANIVYHDAASGESTNLNGGWNSVQDTDPARVLAGGYDDYSEEFPLGASVLTHGFMRALEAAVGRYGSWDWETYFAPAVYFSEQGFEPPHVMRHNVEAAEHLLNATATGRAYLDWALSDNATLVQPEQAAFLRAVAAQGADYMHTGAWAQEAVAAVRAAGGNLTLDDLAAYAPEWAAPRRFSFAGEQVETTAAPEQGGAALMENLRLIEAAGLLRGSSFRENGTALAYMLQFNRWQEVVDVFAHEDKGVAVLQAYFPSVFGPELVELDDLWAYRESEEYVAAVWAAMQPDPGALNAQIDALYGWAGDAVAREDGTHSDAIVARDADGNTCAMVHTLNADPWGTGLFVQGVALSNAASTNSLVVKMDRVAGHRVKVSGPLMPLVAGGGRLALSVVADSLRAGTAQIAALTLGWGVSVAEALQGSLFAYAASAPSGAPLPASVYDFGDCADGDTACEDLNLTHGPFPSAVLDELMAVEWAAPYVVRVAVPDLYVYYHFALPVALEADGDAVNTAIVNGAAVSPSSTW